SGSHPMEPGRPSNDIYASKPIRLLDLVEERRSLFMRFLPWRPIAAGILAVVLGLLAGRIVSSAAFGWLPIWLFFVVLAPLLTSLVTDRLRLAFAMLVAFTMWATFTIRAYVTLREKNLLTAFYDLLWFDIALLAASLTIAATISWAVDNWVNWFRKV